MIEYFKRLFGNDVVVMLGAVWAWFATFLLPTQAVAASVSAVLIIMGLDLVTKLFAIAKQNKGLRKAFKNRSINSYSFAKGTLDKLIIFGVMLVINGCAYNLMIVKDIAVWFSQAVFTIMFLRDAISILENLHDAGVRGLGLFKKLLRNKLEEIYEEKVE